MIGGPNSKIDEVSGEGMSVSQQSVSYQILTVTFLDCKLIRAVVAV
jgi:hypothetical protein